MQYDVDSPEEYIEALDLDWRKDKLLQLRDIILKQDPAIEESINYKMLRFKLNDKGLFHLNAQRGYVSLYCGDTKKLDPDGELLQGLNIGKGCIRFSKTKDISKTRIESFIQRAVSLLKDGVNLDC
ncbi:MAG: DUF1801 domain-containing protein [Acidiferrobacterales bacterium]|nr:DUF1801 domain-containing protein [Acidiferrobacterales bacterium]